MFYKNEPGASSKDNVWTEMQNVFDKWQKEVHSSGYFGNKAKGKSYTGKSREQLFAEWLSTHEGKKLHNKYDSASDIRTPVNKSEEPEIRTLKDGGYIKLNKIAKAFQANDPDMTIEAAHGECSKKSLEYAEIYGLIHDSYPLDEVDFTRQISKSKDDAILLYKAKIDSAARRAGV